MASESGKRKWLRLTDKQLDIIGTLIGWWQSNHELKAGSVWSTEHDGRFTPAELGELDRMVKTAWWDKATED